MSSAREFGKFVSLNQTEQPLHRRPLAVIKDKAQAFKENVQKINLRVAGPVVVATALGIAAVGGAAIRSGGENGEDEVIFNSTPTPSASSSEPNLTPTLKTERPSRFNWDIGANTWAGVMKQLRAKGEDVLYEDGDVKVVIGAAQGDPSVPDFDDDPTNNKNEGPDNKFISIQLKQTGKTQEEYVEVAGEVVDDVCDDVGLPLDPRRVSVDQELIGGGRIEQEIIEEC